MFKTTTHTYIYNMSIQTLGHNLFPFFGLFTYLPPPSKYHHVTSTTWKSVEKLPVVKTF